MICKGFSMKIKLLMRNGFWWGKNVESNKISLEQAPSVCPSRKKARSKLRYECPHYVCADFFRSGPPPPVEPNVLDSTYPQKMPFRTSIKNDAEALKFFVWRGQDLHECPTHIHKKIIGMHNNDRKKFSTLNDKGKS